MSYAIALDNSWDILTEEEMYDVNGGTKYTNMFICAAWKVGMFLGSLITASTFLLTKGYYRVKSKSVWFVTVVRRCEL